jgi:hypothetical protein
VRFLAVSQRVRIRRLKGEVTAAQRKRQEYTRAASNALVAQALEDIFQDARRATTPEARERVTVALREWERAFPAAR